MQLIFQMRVVQYNLKLKLPLNIKTEFTTREYVNFNQISVLINEKCLLTYLETIAKDVHSNHV